MPPSEPAKFPCYVFLFLKRREGVSWNPGGFEFTVFWAYCQVAKLTFPQAIHIVGIATEAGLDESVRRYGLYGYDSLVCQRSGRCSKNPR